jgi:hypothetical protein
MSAYGVYLNKDQSTTFSAKCQKAKPWRTIPPRLFFMALRSALRPSASSRSPKPPGGNDQSNGKKQRVLAAACTDSTRDRIGVFLASAPSYASSSKRWQLWPSRGTAPFPIYAKPQPALQRRLIMSKLLIATALTAALSTQALAVPGAGPPSYRDAVPGAGRDSHRYVQPRSEQLQKQSQVWQTARQ